MKQTTVVLVVLIALTSFSARADETAAGVGSSGGSASHSTDSLPHCVSSADIAKVHDWERANSKSTEFKYTEMKKQLASDSDNQLMARLVYSEATAANCPEHTDALLKPIAAVIENRVARSGDTKATVFAYNQFASSLNFYTEKIIPGGGAKPEDFMCPKDPALWKKAVAAVQSAKSGSVLPGNVGQYYLFHNLTGTPPAWAQATPVAFAGSASVEKCFKAFSGGFPK